ncbi:hypothetical protein NEMBOFW57_001124 [Staphylotrichum longicolle]|uniref:Major facilitator superfamily (MFS) profile domain-containing protein n=1 Tax=Staphylotrichum longicolle TaxID=669026 RepID=A0AAD4F1H4_9PEZI|nr:hypothetical protein NEMBOFW57_001124 [Staphylotrichum longicolle]
MADTEQQAEAKPEPPYSGFTPARRGFIIGLVSTAGFLGPLAGGIYLPALPVLEQDFRVNSTAINVTVSVFMLLCAFAALFWSSISDWKGRRPLYLIALAIYLAANILLAALPANFGALVFLRMVTEPARRGFAMSIFLLGPNLGPTIGPVLGGVITGQASWRWTFGFLAIAVGITWLVMLFAFPETLRFRVGNGAMYSSSSSLLLLPPRLVSPLAPESERGPRPPKPSLTTFWRLFRYPPISIAALYTALMFANYFAIAVGLSDVLVKRYGWSVTAVGGGYLALGVAIVSGSMLAGRFSDWRRARVAKKMPDGKVAPERRLVDQVWGAVVCVAGTVMYGWCVEKGVHPAAVLVATALVAWDASAGAMALET